MKENSSMKKSTVAVIAGILFSLLFTLLIWWAGAWLDTSSFLEDQGASWYFWKLPNPTFWTQATAWGFYLLHQFTVWGLILYAQRRVKKYTDGLHPVNWWALGANAFFILLHFVQTHIWYDGLAQNVSIWSSQVSVIIMLVWILLMENDRRGLFAGKKISFSKQIGQFARKYHGYFFAWGIIYTFWYHPMEATSGHLIGFFYMFLLILQGSLFFTGIHVNRYWTFVQEVMVLFHGTLVAVMQGNNLWPMFFFGFAGILVLTQMFGLGLKRWTRWVIFLGYAGFAAVIYSGRGLNKVYELVSIPLIEYLGVFVLAGLISLGLWITRRFRNEPERKARKISR